MKEPLTTYEKIGVLVSQKIHMRGCREAWRAHKESGLKDARRHMVEAYVRERCLTKKLAEHFNLQHRL